MNLIADLAGANRRLMLALASAGAAGAALLLLRKPRVNMAEVTAASGGPLNGELALTVGKTDVHLDPARRIAFWTSGMAIDADGSPNAYGPNNSGLDYTANAGRDGNWWGLATDGNKNPIVQGPGDPAPGKYVSTTAYANSAYPSGNPRRYVDSERVPYVAVPRALMQSIGVKLGDFAQVLYGGRSCWAIVADVGPAGKIGEGSMALARALGIDESPKRGGTGSGVTWMVYLGTSVPGGAALSAQEIASHGASLLLQSPWGGVRVGGDLDMLDAEEW